MGFPQSINGQDRAVDILAISPRAQELTGRFESLLGSDHEKDWWEGWALARELGPSVESLLEIQWRDNSSGPSERQVLLAAIGLAAGDQRGDKLMSLDGDRLDSLREKVLSQLVLAMGPEATGAGVSVQRLLGKIRPSLAEPILAVSTCLALRQFRESGSPQRNWYSSQDAGIAAAAQFSKPSELPSRWQRRGREHRELVLRGFLLGGSSRVSSEAQSRLAWEVINSDDPSSELLMAAALNLSRTDSEIQLVEVFARPSFKELLPALLESRELRKKLVQGGLLAGQPERRLPNMQRARLALAYGIEADLVELGQNCEEWGRYELTAAAVCLGIAWRMYRGENQWAEEFVQKLPEIPEAEWVRLAMGMAARSEVGGFVDPGLERAFGLAVEGRLPRESAAYAIEDLLWRKGWHLGLTRREAEHRLVADLMFAGSEYGGSKLLLGPNARAYLPKGIPAKDEFFHVAYEFFSFERERGPRVIQEFRLR
ncbi:MAG: hypothetical protein ACYTG5_04445 [Planctomycetota bacterium]|jgi:hypothetical protein